MRLRITHNSNSSARKQCFVSTAEFCLGGAYAVADRLPTGQSLSLRLDRNEPVNAYRLM